MRESLMLMWVRRYLAEGYSLIPLKPKGKEPLIPWTEFQTRKASLEEVQSWLNKWPMMNIGIVTGMISGIVVVDLDGREGIQFKSTQKIVSPIVSRTGNGLQVFYKWTEHVDNSVKKLAPGVDIRGDGGYVVVPPSIHPNRRNYRWQRFMPQLLKPLPQALNQTKMETSISIGKPDGWIAKALEEMKIGNIDDTLVSILGKMRRDNWTQADALSVLRPIAEEKGATNGHIEEKIRNIWSRYLPSSRLQTTGSTFPQPSQQSFGTTSNQLIIHSPNNDDSFNKFQSSISDKSFSDSLQTGFPTLDKYFEGGLKSERLFTIAARTGTGKTNFAIALASHLCQQSKKVLFFSTEFRYEKIWSRYIATLPNGAEFRTHAFYVCDSFSPNLNQVEEAIKNVHPDVFIFDHINQLGEEREGLGAFMQGCNFLQRKYHCQGIMVAQLNRQADWVENGKRIEPRMSMIKGSGTIEQASSRVLLLSETRVTPEYNEILGVLDKNDTGDKGLIQFALYKSPYVFKELV